ncbi:MAG: hypothetical protein H0U65_17110 [Rubrobacter sp.]|jgi:hypothetical protein|nr:hypothetical protein [Rubrobacter sp.]
MVASERLRIEMDDIEREIEEIEDYREMLDLCPKPEGLAGLSRQIRVYFLKRDLERRAHFLRMNRRSAFACYRHIHSVEGTNRPVA